MIRVGAPESGIRLKVASAEEMRQAFRLVHDSYVQARFMDPSASSFRITKHHLLPTSTVLVAVKGGQVIGTMTVVQDGPFGLPIDAIADLSKERAVRARIAELSSLAVHPDLRDGRAQILFSLTKFMFEYATRQLGVDLLVAAVNPRHADFYEGILLFERIHRQTVARYDFVRGNPAVTLALDLSAAPARYRDVYGSFPPHRNLYEYYLRSRFPGFEFPPRKYFQAFDSGMTPELLQELIDGQLALLESLSSRERSHLNDIYRAAPFDSLLSPLRKTSFWVRRRETRFPVIGRGRAKQRHSGGLEVTMLDASAHGFRVHSIFPLRVGERYSLLMAIGPSEVVSLEAEVTWSDGRRAYGFRLENPPRPWMAFLRHLRRELAPRSVDVPRALRA
jgi:hypothetical protein